MKTPHALALALVVTGHVVALAAWDRDLKRNHSSALASTSSPKEPAADLRVATRHRAPPAGDAGNALAR
jgi:hypothetical protein